MKEKSFELRRITTKLRPVRYAVLLPSSVSHQYIIHLINQMSSSWGGNYTLVIPVEGEKIHDVFWEQLIKFDPDEIFPLIPEEENPAKIKQKTKSNSCPFTEMNSDFIYRPHGNITSIIPKTSLMAVMKGIKRGKIIDLDLSDLPEIFQLYFHAVTGKLNKEMISEFKKENEIDFESKKYTLDSSNINDLLTLFWEQKDYSIERIIKRTHERDGKIETADFNLSEIYPNLPFQITQSNLGIQTYSEKEQAIPTKPYDSPIILIIGSSISDFCLYSSSE